MITNLADEIIRLVRELATGIQNGDLKAGDSTRLNGVTLEELKSEIKESNERLSKVQAFLIIIHSLVLLYQAVIVLMD